MPESCESGPGALERTGAMLPTNHMLTEATMDNIQRNPEESRQSSNDYKELIQRITRDSIQKRLKYTPCLKRDEVTLQVDVDIYEAGT